MDDNEKSLLNICLRRYCLLLRDKYLKNESESKKKSYRDQFPLDFIHMVHKTARKMHIIDDNFVTFIIPSIRDLSELIIPKCKITSIGLIKIIEECKLLKKVDLSFCENISDTGFKNIIGMYYYILDLSTILISSSLLLPLSIELKELVYLNVESTQIEGSTLVTYKGKTYFIKIYHVYY